MIFNREYWLAQAEDMEMLIGMRSAAVEVLQLRRELKETQERAAIFEEWKDKVEEQRRGLEVQVGEIERQRRGLEVQVGEIERQRRGLEVQVGEIESQRCALEQELQKLQKRSLIFNLKRLISKIRKIFRKV